MSGIIEQMASQAVAWDKAMTAIEHAPPALQAQLRRVLADAQYHRESVVRDAIQHEVNVITDIRRVAEGMAAVMTTPEPATAQEPDYHDDLPF